MSRQFDEAIEGRFDIYGEEYRLVEPENIDELIRALEVKATLQTYLVDLYFRFDAALDSLLLENLNLQIKSLLEKYHFRTAGVDSVSP